MINNACATQALINVIMNCQHKDVDIGDTLKNFKEFCTGFEADVSNRCGANGAELMGGANGVKLMARGGFNGRFYMCGANGVELMGNSKSVKLMGWS